MRSSDSRHGSSSHAGPLRFLDFSFPMRCLQSPRGVRRLLSGVASPAMTDFSISGSMVTPSLCNEAESSSLALRLTGSPHRASVWGLLLSPPSWLHDGHQVITMITFQIIREVRLSLTHRNTRKARKNRTWNSAYKMLSNAVEKFHHSIRQLKVREEGREGEPDFRAIAPFGHIFRVSFALQYAYTASVCFLESTPKPSH